MDPQSLAETGRKLNVSILKSHDDKRFRVRTLADVREIYGTYFNQKAAARIAKIQVVLAVLVAACQVVTMSSLRYHTSLERLGLGNWMAVLTLFAAASVIWTCKNTSYLRLHLSMAMHIVVILFSMLFLLLSFEESIPNLRRRLYSNYLTPGLSEQVQGYNSVFQLDRDLGGATGRPVKYYSKEHGPISITALALTLTALMAVTTMVQLALSVIMAVMTARAMCIGRIKMEGKLFAMEIAGREDKDTFVVIPCQQPKPQSVPALPTVVTNSTDHQPQRVVVPSPPPPSYNKVLLGHNDTDSAA